MTEVLDSDFEWHDGKLVHMPTGAVFTPGSDWVNWGRAGEVLDDGREYDMGELLSAALRMIFAAARKG